MSPLKKITGAFALTVVMALSVPTGAQALSEKDKRAIAGVAGALLGAAAIAAASKHHRHENHRYHSGQRRYYAAPFSPTSSVIC